MKVPHPATSEGASSRCWRKGSQASVYRAAVREGTCVLDMQVCREGGRRRVRVARNRNC